MCKTAIPFVLLLTSLAACQSPQDGTPQTNPNLVEAEMALPGMEGLAWHMPPAAVAGQLGLLPKAGILESYTITDTNIDGCSFSRMLGFDAMKVKPELVRILLRYNGSAEGLTICQTRVVAGFKSRLGSHPDADIPDYFRWVGNVTSIIIQLYEIKDLGGKITSTPSQLQIEYKDWNNPIFLPEE